MGYVVKKCVTLLISFGHLSDGMGREHEVGHPFSLLTEQLVAIRYWVMVAHLLARGSWTMSEGKNKPAIKITSCNLKLYKNSGRIKVLHEKLFC